MKTGKLAILIIGGYFFLICCQSKASTKTKTNQSKFKQPELDTLIQIQSDTICFNNYKLEVVSEIIREATDNDEKHYFPVICISQKLIFYDNNKKIAEKKISVSKMKYSLNSGKVYDILENEILYVGVVIGKKGFLFSIVGDGGCNECSELYALYSQNGELLYLDYFEKDSIYSQIGNLNDELNKIGTSETDFFKHRNKQIFRLF